MNLIDPGKSILDRAQSCYQNTGLRPILAPKLKRSLIKQTSIVWYHSTKINKASTLLFTIHNNEFKDEYYVSQLQTPHA